MFPFLLHKTITQEKLVYRYNELKLDYTGNRTTDQELGKPGYFILKSNPANI